MAVCATEIRQDANQLYRAGHAAVEKSLEFKPGANGEAKALLRRIVEEVSDKSELVRAKVAQMKTSIMEADEIADSDIDRMTSALSEAISMFNGMITYLQGELDGTDVQDEDVKGFDRQILRSAVLVRNDIESLLSLLGQMKADDPLEVEGLFASREDVLEVAIRGIVELGYSESDARDMVH